MYKPMVLILIVSLFFSFLLGAGEGQVIAEVDHIGLVIADNTPILADYRDPSKVIQRLNLGDAFWVLRTQDDIRTQENVKIILSGGNIVWIKRDYCHVMEIDLVNGSGKEDLYPVFDSFNQEKIIAKRKKGERFNIDRMVHIQSGKKREIMLHVTYQTYNPKKYFIEDHEQGWVRLDDVVLSLEGVFFSSIWHREKGNWQTAGWRSLPLDTAVLFSKRVIKDYPDVYFRVRDFCSTEIHSSAQAMRELAWIYADQGKFDLALATSQQVIQKYRDIYSQGERSEPYAYSQEAQIYWKYMGQPRRALKSLHKILENFSEENLWGFEWSSTWGVEAIKKISQLSKDLKWGTNTQLGQYRRALHIAKSSTVKVLIAQKVADLLKEQGKIQQAIDLLKQTINKNPCAFYNNWMYSTNFSQWALQQMIQYVIKDQNHYHKAIRLCGEIFINTKDSKCGSADFTDPVFSLSIAALYFQTALLDYSHGSREMVLRNYRNWLNVFPKPESWSKSEEKYLMKYTTILRPEKNDFWSLSQDISYGFYYLVIGRLREIEAFKPGKKNTASMVSVYQCPDLGSGLLANLLPYTEVTILYNLDFRGKWVKIRLADDRIGWVQESQL